MKNYFFPTYDWLCNPNYYRGQASDSGMKTVQFVRLKFLLYILLLLNVSRVCWLHYQFGAKMSHLLHKWFQKVSFSFLPFLKSLTTCMPVTKDITLCFKSTYEVWGSVSVDSSSYFSGWWNILPRPGTILNRGPHCLLWALACICNVITLKPSNPQITASLPWWEAEGRKPLWAGAK